MKIRITDSSPVWSEYPINQLIGQEFEVKDSDKNGYYIGYGETGLYFIHSHECEEVVE
ncbi:hypothetical protein [Paenibacillus sp. ISL-20]|uniref:hypothetical protein n=1 Tax=Paenibacillus sp. ISL-20 TaxID=2819163 RepID=UPI001BE5137E|nr:hypothetical protein [Paenibacillus sp. ISL-20]MBT2759992.1 hypothetical protein [Paenibacillus sp. ISL-20]